MEAWDEGKENAAPRTEGKAAKAAQVLAARDGPSAQAGQAQHLQAKRAQLWREAELATSTSEADPLARWLHLIELEEVEQPSLATGSAYLTALERCANLFRDYSTYKDDPRYVRLWIKLVKSVPQPAEALAFMEARSIGSNLALFYECKAMFLEQRGEYDAAEDTLSLGIARNAQPLQRLQHRHSAFSERMKRRAQRYVAPESVFSHASGAQRRFGQLVGGTSFENQTAPPASEDNPAGVTTARFCSGVASVHDGNAQHAPHLSVLAVCTSSPAYNLMSSNLHTRTYSSYCDCRMRTGKHRTQKVKDHSPHGTTSQQHFSSTKRISVASQNHGAKQR
jgi:hypothetical protein